MYKRQGLHHADPVADAALVEFVVRLEAVGTADDLLISLVGDAVLDDCLLYTSSWVLPLHIPPLLLLIGYRALRALAGTSVGPVSYTHLHTPE